jgi:hypothetical protein
MMLRRHFGCKEEEVMLGWIIRNNEKFNYYFLLFTEYYEADKINEDQIFEACSKHRDEKCMITFVRKPEGRRPVGRSVSRLEILNKH